MISYKIISIVETLYMQIKTFEKAVRSPLPDRKGSFRNGNRTFEILKWSNQSFAPFLIAHVQITPTPGESFIIKRDDGTQCKVVIIKNNSKR